MPVMTCEEAMDLLAAYGDGELPLPRALEFERHVETCVKCAQALYAQREIGKALRSVPYHRAPNALRARLQGQWQAASPPEPVSAAPPTRLRRDFARWALPLAAALVLTLGLNQFTANRQSDDALVVELIDSHVRSLQGDHIADVASSDHHTVKPWYTGKLDYSPPVRDLAAQDFPLVGGRLDYLAKRSVAALVYHHGKHVINLYVWPGADKKTSVRAQMRDGYNLVHWSADGMNWWAISDVNPAELRQFANLLNTAEPPAAAPGA